MKRFLMIAVLVTALMALVAGTALAAGPGGYGQAQGTPPRAQDPATCPMGGARAGMMAGRPAWAGQPDGLAEFLGVTAEEIQAERLAGESLADIAVANGKSEQELIDFMLAAKTETLNALVADGKITAEQADAMIEHMKTQVQTMVERTTTGAPAGRGQGMRGQGYGMGRGQGMRGGQGANR